MTGFNLTREPWLPAQTLDGQLVTLTLPQALAEAHRLRDLSVPDTMRVALHRLLLAVLRRALDGPATAGQWGRLWEERRLPAGRITAYLADHAAGFDLFDPARPFAQTPGMGCRDTAVTNLTDRPDRGAGAGWWGGLRAELEPDAAARWLLWTQLWDTGGIRSDPAGGRAAGVPAGPAAYGTLVHVAGRTLAETLILSLPLYAPVPGDAGWWERTDPPQRRKGLLPAGPVHALTWGARRVRLSLQGDGLIRRVQIAAGDDTRTLPDDPHAAAPWSASAPGGVTDLAPGRLTSLVDVRPEQPGREPGREGDGGRPAVLDHLAAMTAAGALDADHRVQVVVTGIGYDQYRAMMRDSGHLALPAMPVAAWSPGTGPAAAIAAIAGELQKAEQAASDAAAQVAQARRLGREQIAAARRAAVIALRWDCRSATERLLRSLGVPDGPGDEARVAAWRDRLHEQIQELAADAGTRAAMAGGGRR